MLHILNNTTDFAVTDQMLPQLLNHFISSRLIYCRRLITLFVPTFEAFRHVCIFLKRA